MINLIKGEVTTTEGLCVSPQFTFKDFQQSKFYSNQTSNRIIYLDKIQIIDAQKYVISLFFLNSKIYMVSLVCCDEDYSEEDEPKRKLLHDRILKMYGIEQKRKFSWGSISSEYDGRSNCSSINIMYN